MNIFKQKNTYFIFLVIHSISAIIDLEEQAQDFIITTKRIVLPDYPYAFNPSIIRWHDKLLLSFRVIPDPKHSFNSWLGLVWLDEHLDPIGEPQQLQLRSPQSTIPSRAEDGRLVMIGQTLYFVYSDNEDPAITRGGFRMYIAQLEYDGQNFMPIHIERLTYFEDNNEKRREKNWVPFDYNGTMLLAYSLAPHKILCPLLDGTQHCKTLISSESPIDWQWGDLRGGTPGLIDGNHYLAFFHSSKKMATIHSQGKEMPHYFMGAYTFARDFPFTITSISPEPIIGKQFYHGDHYKPWWGSVRVVFPCGFVFYGDYIWLAYGREDHELWIAQLDKKKLYESLIPVASDKRHSLLLMKKSHKLWDK